MKKTLTVLSGLAIACLLAGSASAADLITLNFDSTDTTTIQVAGPSGGAVYKFGGGACGGYSSYDGRLDIGAAQGTTVAGTDMSVHVQSNTNLVYCDTWGSFYGLSINNGGAGDPNTSVAFDISSATASGTIEFDIKAGAADQEASGNPAAGLQVGTVPRGISMRLEDNSGPNFYEIYRFAIPAFGSTWTHVSLPLANYFSGTGAQAGFRAINPADFRKIVFVEGDFGGNTVDTYAVDFYVDNVRITTGAPSAVENWTVYQ